MARSRFAWGIDIGNRALKAIKLVREGGGVRIDDFDVIEHETILSNAGDNRESLIQTALAIFAGKHSVKGGNVAVGVSGQQSFARFIKLPPVEDRRIPEIVKFEAIQQIPFPLDEVEWSYQLFRNEGSPDVEVGIFAMRKDLVQQHIRYFTDTGMNVEAVQMNPLAVYNGLYHDRRLEGTTMIIDLGADNADLIIAEGEQIWMRSVPIGGNNFTEALTKAFKLRFEKAEELKRNAATSKYGRQILQAMRPIFADLVAEIQRSIGFYSSVHRDSRIQKVLALGGTFRLPGLQKYLQQNLSLDVVKVDQLGDGPPKDTKVATALNEDILSAVGAYGLALQALGEGKITSSLLPQVIRQEREWKAKTPIFAAAAAICVAGAVLPHVRLSSDKYKFEQAAQDRRTIDTIRQTADGLSKKWTSIASAGATDRKRATDVLALSKFRDLWPELYKDIRDCVPQAPVGAARATSGPAAAGSDRRIFIDDIQVEYHPDVSSFLTVAEATLNAQPPPRSRGGIIPGHGAAAGVLIDNGPSAAAATGTPAVGPDGQPVAMQRGFVLWVHAITPSREGSGYVENTFVTNLKKRITVAEEQLKKLADPTAALQPGGAKHPTYQIRRASIPFSKQFFADDDRKRILQERYAFLTLRKSASGLAHLFTPFPPGVPAGAPPMQNGPASSVEVKPEETSFFIDPETKEDTREWWDVSVRIVVVIEPTPMAAAPKAAAAPAEE